MYSLNIRFALSFLLILVLVTSLFTSNLFLYQSLSGVKHGISKNITLNQESSPFFDFGVKVAPPQQGIYLGANPGFGGTEDIVTVDKIVDFENLIHKKIAWAYFSNNWIDEIKFPEASVKTIDNLGIIPFIRMMPRTDFSQGNSDPVFSLQGIIDGNFDESLRQWAIDAKNTNIPLMVEFGTEVNGNWFPWSGAVNGGSETEGYGDPYVADGPERFKDAYRHIIDLFRNEGVNNITWVFHVFPSEEVESNSSNDDSWDSIANYYPGDDYIDWIGTSIYGSADVGNKWKSFSEIMNETYPELESLSENKPIAILELGIIEDQENGNKTNWIQDALQSLESGKYPRISAISYWNEKWDEGDKVFDLTLNSSSETLNTFKELISSPTFLSDVMFEYYRSGE